MSNPFVLWQLCEYDEWMELIRVIGFFTTEEQANAYPHSDNLFLVNKKYFIFYDGSYYELLNISPIKSIVVDGEPKILMDREKHIDMIEENAIYLR